ncbi:UPF0187-domain-containing protein, partial [Fistulina hepatica ATCC 64428]
LASRRKPASSFVSAVLATALFRCWHILLFYGAWSTLITVLNHKGISINFPSTVLTVVGTVLGFVISYRTTSSFERYNEGRRLWSQIILASRTFARTVWFNVQGIRPRCDVLNHQSMTMPSQIPRLRTTQMRGRSMIERKSVINLLEAFGVAVKHYLRGEDGIYYQDLYYLVKFLPAYALPAGIVQGADLTRVPEENEDMPGKDSAKLKSVLVEPGASQASRNEQSNGSFMYRRTDLPLPVTQRAPRTKKLSFVSSVSDTVHRMTSRNERENDRTILHVVDEKYLLPAATPPKYHLFDIFPFSLLVRRLTQHGHKLGGKKAARLRAKMREVGVSHNLPLEISLYLGSYIAALQIRKQSDVSTVNALLAALNQLVDALTGLERILTTPIPFSYSIHLWVVTIIYCLALPLQIWTYLGWITIPSTTVISFMFFGFLVAGEEIENPFGYDKNDLNLDHFTNNIIRNELRAITSAPPPNPSVWAFVAENDLLFSAPRDERRERVTPNEWLERGFPVMQTALAQT